MKSLLLICVAALIVSGQAVGVELAETPIQDAIQMQLAMDEWDVQPSQKKDNDDKSKGSDQRPSARKSVVRAAVYSALIPGAGEFYQGNREKARIFFVGEALTWIGYAAFRIQGNWKKEDYIQYGNQWANASLDDKDEHFHDMVGFYDDLYEYNSFGRAWDPERPYYPDTPEYHWHWTSDEHQRIYRDLKNEAGEAHRRARFMVGIAVVARVISVIDTIRDGIRMNRRASSDFSELDEKKFDFDIDPLKPSKIVTLTYYP